MSLKTFVIGSYAKLFIYLHPIESVEVKKGREVSAKGGYTRSKIQISFQNGGIYDTDVGYTEVTENLVYQGGF